MESVTVIIPVNYTEAGKLFGMFEMRCALEAAVLCLPILLICLFLLPFGLTVNLIIAAVFAVPAAGFSLMGIQGYSLFTFIKIYFKWRRFKKAQLDK